MYRENAIKRRLAEGRPSLGCWLNLADPLAAELVGLTGYDCVMIDHEHGPGTLGDARALLQAVSATRASALMRVPWNDPVYIKRVLDLGVEGVMIPSVNTPDEARRAIEGCLYPPHGRRGCAIGLVRASNFGMAPSYADDCGANLLIICQIESVEAIEAIPDIAAVPGVDMLFVGPYDLSGSIGKLGRFDDPDVRTLIDRAERAILDAGIWYGSIPSPARSTESLVDAGCKLVLAGSDIGLLRDAALNQVQAFRRLTGAE